MEKIDIILGWIGNGSLLITLIWAIITLVNQQKRIMIQEEEKKWQIAKNKVRERGLINKELLKDENANTK